MTPFMLRVSQTLDLGAGADLPQVQFSRPLPAAIGTHGHVECRSLAEQLVCEANVVLSSSGCDRLTLTDDPEPGRLSFCISYRDRQARIETHFGRAVSTGHLYGVGARHLGDVELAGSDQVEQLLLFLVADEGIRLGGGATFRLPERCGHDGELG
jgi:hypothetical protein